MYLRFLDYSKGKALVLDNLKAVSKKSRQEWGFLCFMGIAMLLYTYVG